MFESLFLKLQFDKEYRELEEQLNPAEKNGSKQCCRSGLCCWRRPGTLSENDVNKIAEFLNLTPQELFKKYLAVDIFGTDYCLIFIRKHQIPGVMIPWRETYSLETPCVFLDEENNNACKIHNAKPEECATFKCWDRDKNPAPHYKMSREYLLSLGWDGHESS